MSAPLNVVGQQVRIFRKRLKWSQALLAQRLQLEAWDVSRESVAKLEAQLRRVPDCELLYLAKVLGVEIPDLFPKSFDLRKNGPIYRINLSTKAPRKKARPRKQ